MLSKKLILMIALLAAPFTALANGGKVEVIGAFADQSASESVRKALDLKGYRVTLEDGSAWCDIWLRAGVPTRAKVDLPGVMLPEIAESTLIGVIAFPKDATDFRGQPIKPGAYTLRYSLHPVDGNHLGISVYRDFLLMIPIQDDKDADATFKFDDLAKMSSKAAGTNHPAPLDLVYPEGKGENPTVAENDEEHLVFHPGAPASSSPISRSASLPTSGLTTFRSIIL